MNSTMQRLRRENAQLRRRNAFGDAVVLGTCLAAIILWVWGWI